MTPELIGELVVAGDLIVNSEEITGCVIEIARESLAGKNLPIYQKCAIVRKSELDELTKLKDKLGRKSKAHDFTRMMWAAEKATVRDCLETLESVRDYLKEGTCRCDVLASLCGDNCQRCRMLADVDTTIKNTKP